jgi:prefoldin alpha subunit
MPKKSAQPKPKKDKKEELQTKYIQLQLLKQQFQELAETRNTLLERMSDITTSIDALQKLDSIKKGDEIWSSIGSSAFVKSDIKDTENVLVGIGAGVIVKENRARATELLESRLSELKKIEQEILTELSRFAQAIGQLEPQVEQLAHEQAEE